MIRPVFQNDNFIICDKPSLVLSTPAREKNDPRPCLGLELQKQLGRKIYPVHRLDFEVSGLIIYALNERAHRISQDWFQQKKISKIYSAETSLQNFSHWPENVSTDRAVLSLKSGAEFYWRTKIHRGKRRSFESPHGEWAETRAIVRELTSDSVIWEMHPITGKSHQLRLELSRHGFPIDGDRLYGSSRESRFGPGISLRAVRIDLEKIQDRLGLPAQVLSTLSVSQ